MILGVFAPIATLGQSKETELQKERPVTFNEVLTKLRFTYRINQPLEQLNMKLTAAVRKRSVNFLLSEKDKKALKEAGGSDELIKAIDDAIPPEKKERMREQIRLDTIYRENYDGNYEQRKKAIEAGKEFLLKFGDDEDVKEFVDYLRNALPVLEERIQQSRQIDRPNICG
jgi:hypothetical protein